MSELELEADCESDSCNIGAVLPLLCLGLAKGSSSEDKPLVEGQCDAVGSFGFPSSIPSSSEPNSSEASPQLGTSAPHYNGAINLIHHWRAELQYTDTFMKTLLL